MKMILIVHDRQAPYLTYHKILKSSGIRAARIFSTEDLVDALEWIHDVSFDLIVIDIQSSFMNVDRLVQSIRRFQPRVKVLIAGGDAERRAPKGPSPEIQYYHKDVGPIRFLERVMSGLVV